MRYLFSIIIPTYKRHKELWLCLSSISRQTKKNNFEVIIVDNSCDKEIKKLVESHKKQILNIRYVSESQIGLSHSKNKGIAISEGKYCVFFDDDVIISEDWVENASEFYDHHKDVRIFGGPYSRHCYAKIPEWYPPSMGTLNHGSKEKIINIKKQWLTGANMVVERDLLEKVNGFDINLGMSGEKRAYGEETELLYRINKGGIPIWYVPSLKISHLLNEQKLSLKWLLFNSYESGKTVAQSQHRKLSLTYLLASLIHKLAFFIISFFQPSPLPLKRRLYYSLNGLFSWAGSLRSWWNLTVCRKTL